jgi:hypothetical protein
LKLSFHPCHPSELILGQHLVVKACRAQCEKKINRFYTLADWINVAITGGIIILAVLASAVTVAPSKHL